MFFKNIIRGYHSALRNIRKNYDNEQLYSMINNKQRIVAITKSTGKNGDDDDDDDDDNNKIEYIPEDFEQIQRELYDMICSLKK
jgi:hypothetical protein